MSAKKKQIYEENLNIAYYLILPLLLFPAFFRGLFFDYEADIAHIYTALVLAVYVYFRKQYVRLPHNIMDYAFIGLAAAYIISNFVAFNQRAALEQALRIINFLIIYWILSRTIKSIKDIRIALTVMFTAGVGVALAGLGTAYGTFSFNGAYAERMILSTLQYHNAAAIYLVACGVIGLYLTAVYDNRWLRVGLAGMNYVVVSTAFGAGSRGAMLVAPIGLLLLILGQPRETRLKVFMSFLAVLMPFFVTAKQVLNFEAHSQGYYWGWLLAGILIACGLQLAVEKLMSVTQETRKKVVAGLGIAITLAVVGIIIFYGSALMPSSIADRLSNINFQQHSVQERGYFYSDAFKLIKEYPIIGVGGGGWNSAYTWYQSYLYYTTEVHSHPLQIWVETGTLGFFFYCLLWLGLIITVVKILRKVESPEYRAAAWTAAVTAVSISLHSVIDFSLSLGSVAILMYGLIGLVRATERVCFEEDSSQAKPVSGPVLRQAAGIGLAVVFLIISSSLFIAAQKEREAIRVYNTGDVQGAIDVFESAKTYDPLNFNYPMYLASLYNNLAYQTGNFVLTGKSVENAEKAVSLNEKAGQPLWMLAETYLAAQRTDEAIIKGELAQQSMRWRQDGYENLGRIYVSAANQYIQRGDKGKAGNVLKKMLDMPKLIEENISKVEPKARGLWVRGPIPEVNENIQKQIDEANRLLGTL